MDIDVNKCAGQGHVALTPCAVPPHLSMVGSENRTVLLRGSTVRLPCCGL